MSQNGTAGTQRKNNHLFHLLVSLFSQSNPDVTKWDEITKVMGLAYRAVDPFSLWMAEPLLTLSSNNLDYSGRTGLPFGSDLNDRMKRSIFGIMYHEKPGALQRNGNGMLEFVFEVSEVVLEGPETFRKYWTNGINKFKPILQEVMEKEKY